MGSQAQKLPASSFLLPDLTHLPDPRPPKPSGHRDTHLVQGWQAWSLPGEKCPGGHGAQSATESAGSAHLPALGCPEAHSPGSPRAPPRLHATRGS